jgi:pyruvate formate lyase activating enzyme
MTDRANTAAAQLVRAAELGAEEGLRFVYAGNAPGRVGPWENTFCPNCREELISRFGYLVRDYRITPKGECPKCGANIPGIWPAEGAEAVSIGQDIADYYARLPRGVSIHESTQTAC